MPSQTKYHLAIFASGTGSNAQEICKYFAGHPDIQVKLIITNRKEAGVLHVANSHNIPGHYIPKSKWEDKNEVLPLLDSNSISHIVLAGFLLLVPQYLINVYRDRIINIHPALLPQHGGKGMYGKYVHESVKRSGELISGITIHHVDEYYDEGDIIFQEKIDLEAGDAPEDIARKVLKLEHYYYPRIIEQWVLAKK